MARFNPLAAAVAAGSMQVSGIADYINTFEVPFNEFANAAIVADQRNGLAKDSGKAGAVWPHARKLMVLVTENKLTPADWQTVLTHFMLQLKLENSATAKSYQSTLKNAPYALASPVATKINGNKPVDLSTASYADVRNTMKAVKDEMFAAHDPVAVKFANKLASIKESLTNVVKDKAADKKAGLPALKGISYTEGLELLEALEAFIPERKPVVAETESDTPISDAANETVEGQPVTKVA